MRRRLVWRFLIYRLYSGDYFKLTPKASNLHNTLTLEGFCSLTHLLDVLFDLSGDERVVNDRQNHRRVVSGDPATHQQPAVRQVTALREEDLQHHGACRPASSSSAVTGSEASSQQCYADNFILIYADVILLKQTKERPQWQRYCSK